MIIKGADVISSDVQANARKYVYRGSLTAVTGTTVNGILDLVNDTGVDLLVTLFYIDVTTKSTGAATADFGIDDLGDTSNDTLIDGVDVGTAAIQASNVVGGGTNGKVVKWPKTYHLGGTASATLAGLVGTYYIEAVPKS